MADKALVLTVQVVEELINLKGELEERLSEQIKVNTKLLEERNRARGALAEIRERASEKGLSGIVATCNWGLGGEDD